MVWVELVWVGLGWVGLVWFGLVWFGLVCFEDSTWCPVMFLPRIYVIYLKTVFKIIKY